MILATASLLVLSTLSLSSSVGRGILDFGTTVADAVNQSPHISMPSSDVWTLLMMVGFFVLCIKAIVTLALFFRSYAPRLSVSSSNRFRWLFGMAFLLPVFSSVAFAFRPFASDAFISLARHVPADGYELCSFIQQGIAIGNCFDKLGNFIQLLMSAKEALHQRYSDVSVLFESLDIITHYHELTCAFNSAFTQLLSRVVRSAVDVTSNFDFISSTLRLSLTQALAFGVIMCLIMNIYKLYVSTRELKVALKMRDDAMSVEAEVFKKERAFYKTRVATLHNTNEGLITALESALPRITTAELRCAQARAYVNQLEVALEDLGDAHAVDTALFESSLAASEEKATKAAAHARSLNKMSKVQRSTISSLRVSSDRLIKRCSTLEDAISTLSTRNDQLETMVHHLRIGIAKLASASPAPLVDEFVSLYEDAEEASEAVITPYANFEDRMDCGSYEDSLSDFVDEDECTGSSDAVLSFAGIEAAAESLLSAFPEDPTQTFDTEAEKGEILDPKPSDTFLVPHNDTREPAPALSSHLPLIEASECLSEDGGSRAITSTTCDDTHDPPPQPLAHAATNPSTTDLLEAAETFLHSIFAELARSESSSLLTSRHGDVVDVANLGPESPSPVDSSRTEDNLHHLSTSIFAPVGSRPLHSAHNKETLLSEMIFRDASSGSPSSPSTDAPSEAGLLTPANFAPSFLFSQRNAYAFSPCRLGRAGNTATPHTPVCTFKGKVKASITASTRKFLANKENSMPQA